MDSFQKKLVTRRDHRVFAMQQVCSALILNLDKKILVKNLFENSLIDIEDTFALKLIEGVLENKEQLIKRLNKHFAKDWTFNRLDCQDKAVLLIAAYEFIHNKLDIKIIINEAVEIAKIYSSKHAYKYINATLDKLKGV